MATLGEAANVATELPTVTDYAEHVTDRASPLAPNNETLVLTCDMTSSTSPPSARTVVGELLLADG